MITVEVTVISFALALVLGLVLALARLSRFKAVSWLAHQYIDAIRGTPLLVQLFLIYFGLPQIGITLEAFPSAIIGLTINTSAYVAETLRAGIQAIPKGQLEAARSLGFSQAAAMRYIVIPQALRVVVPPLGNEFIILLKDSSLVSTITLIEMVRTAQRIIAATYRPIELYLAVAVIYWLLTKLFTYALGRLERRLRSHV